MQCAGVVGKQATCAGIVPNSVLRRTRSVKYTSAVACTLTLKDAVEPYPMLVDTGSSVTLLIHENIWKEVVKNSQKMLHIPVMAVNSESLPLCSPCDITGALYVGVHNALVVHDTAVFHGTDFHEQCRCVFNMDNKTLTMAGHRHPVQLFAWDVVLFAMLQYGKPLLYPKCSSCSLRTRRRYIQHCCWLCEPNTEFSDELSCLLVARSVPQYRQEGGI